MRIQDLSTTIPYGWQLQMPDAHLSAGTYYALQGLLWQYQDARGLERWNDATLQDCLCKNLPIHATSCDEGETPHMPDLDALPAFRVKEDNVFGPILWGVLHNKRISEESHPAMWLREWQRKIPCVVCSAHFQQVVNELPPDFSSDDAFFVWGWKSHNLVNKSIGKRQMPLDETKQLYGRED